MSRSSLPLALYRLAGRGVGPFAPAFLRWRRRRGLEDRHRMRERMGIASLPRPEGRLVWVQAASVADGVMLIPLIERLGARGFHVLLSTRTLASANALKRQLPAGSFHQFMPLDVPRFVKRHLDYWQPDIVLLAGAEIWPTLLVETKKQATPVIAVNARMSDRVFGYCRTIPRFTRALLAHVDLCLARSALDAARFRDLGAPSVQVVGDLAFDIPALRVDPLAVTALASRAGGRPIWVAALLDEGEIPFVIETHRLLLERVPDVLTILVPNLSRDGAGAMSVAASLRVQAALRSTLGARARLPGLYVADVAGETGLFFRVGDIAFIGRSMAGGGRSPVEAAKLGCAVLHGPRVDGFAELYAALDEAQGAALVGDAATLARIVALLFDDGTKLRRMQRNAAETIDRMCGGTTRIMRALEPHVVQMMVER